MKKNLSQTLWIVFLLFACMLAGSQKVMAADTTLKYDIDVELGTQSVWNKRVPVTVRFKPNIDARDTEISWDYSEGVEIVKNYTDYFPTKAGQVYTVTAYIVPLKEGTYNITANVTGWTDTNYSASKGFVIEFSKSLVQTPASAEYRTNQMIQMGVIVLVLGVLIFVIIKLVKIGTKKMMIWLKPPQF